MCFILELLEKDKHKAKLLGVVRAFDTISFTSVDIQFTLLTRKNKTLLRKAKAVLAVVLILLPKR